MDYVVPLFFLAIVCNLTSAKEACGGCTGTPTTADICTSTSTSVRAGSSASVIQTRIVTFTEAYACYTYTHYFIWVLAREKICYRRAYRQVKVLVPPSPPGGQDGTPSQPCCEGYTRTSTSTCTRCGRNKYPGTIPSGPVKMIVGGTTTRPNQYPWMVRLTSHFYGYYSNCGGTIIGKRWILTAAHCVEGSYMIYSYITVGDHDQRPSHSGTTEKRYPYSKLYTHPDYSRASGVTNYDIALIETSEDIQFNEDVQPACLPKKQAKYRGETVTLTGWGKINGTSELLPVHLQHTTATIVDPSRCNIFMFKNVMCAQGVDTSVCQGDSGGPMIFTVDGYSTVIGVSWWSVRGCPAGAQFGYTDVGAYLDWINGVMFK